MGGYFTSRAGDPFVIVRMKDDDDGAEPSSNSTAVVNLIRLHSLLQNASYSIKIEKLLKQFSERLLKVPITLPVMASALTSFTKGPVTFVLVQKDLKILPIRQHLLPTAASCIGVQLGNKEAIETLVKLLPHAKIALSKEITSDTIFMIRGQAPSVIVQDLEKLSL
jgi:uncharacterized protein YyaL (SSP411 family)